MKRFLNPYLSIPIVFVVAIGLFSLVVYLATRKPRETINRRTCPSNLKQIALGMFMYSQDYDEKLPPAIFNGKTVGWVNGLQPYLKSHQLFQCFREPNPSQDNPHLPGFTDYWMNKNVAGVEIRLDVNPRSSTLIRYGGDPSSIILMGDGDGGSPASTASYAIDRLPTLWRQAESSPAKRHHGGANYAFADGHVKMLKPDEISQLPSSQNEGVHTFSIR